MFVFTNKKKLKFRDGLGFGLVKSTGSMQRADKFTKIFFDGKAFGKSVRFCEIDGTQYVSIRDVIMYVCNVRSENAIYAWKRFKLSQENTDAIQEYVKVFKEDNKGKNEQPVITFPGVLKFVNLLSFVINERVTSLVNFLSKYCTRTEQLTDNIQDSLADAPEISMDDSWDDQESDRELNYANLVTKAQQYHQGNRLSHEMTLKQVVEHMITNTAWRPSFYMVTHGVPEFYENDFSRRVHGRTDMDMNWWHPRNA